MVFVTVPETKVWFCIWKTRVQDFQEFVEETRYDATTLGWALSPTGGPTGSDYPPFHPEVTSTWSVGHVSLPESGTWMHPGFEQGPTHPVCGVSWVDAHAFCAWLTKRERQTGAIAADKVYRLPTDVEWSTAVGSTKYCWGNQWPPPARAGNFAGEEVLDASWPTNRAYIRGYRDGFPRTSPVGSFAANRYGLYDLGGNLGEWCEDLFRKEMNPDELRKQYREMDFAPLGCRVSRGASWSAATPRGLNTALHGWGPPNSRSGTEGFRVVLTRDELGKALVGASRTETYRAH